MNWFVFSVGVLQSLGACHYWMSSKPKFALLYFLYGLTNFVIFFMRGE